MTKKGARLAHWPGIRSLYSSRSGILDRRVELNAVLREQRPMADRRTCSGIVAALTTILAVNHDEPTMRAKHGFERVRVALEQAVAQR